MRRMVIVVFAALLVVPLYVKSRPGQNVSARPAFHVISSGRILIKVSGDVRHPGIYEVPAKSLAISAINMAIPIKPLGQDTIEAVAATPLLNGCAVNLVAGAEVAPHIAVDMMTVAERMVLGIPLDISRMSEADFDRLPGIGPALAKRIVLYRQKNGGILQVGDLTAIEGIGEKKLELIQKYVQPAVTKE
jgi:competence protein ComEA